MNLKKWIEDIKGELSQSKSILKTKWDIGANAGKNLKKQHKEKLKEVKRKTKKDERKKR
jgi:hypothetical protein